MPNYLKDLKKNLEIALRSFVPENKIGWTTKTIKAVVEQLVLLGTCDGLLPFMTTGNSLSDATDWANSWGSGLGAVSRIPGPEVP